MSFGQLLRACRSARGMGTTELAQVLGVGKSYISNLERGAAAAPSLDKVFELARILACDPLPLAEAAMAEKKSLRIPLDSPDRVRLALAMCSVLAEDDPTFTEEVVDFILTMVEGRR